MRETKPFLSSLILGLFSSLLCLTGCVDDAGDTPSDSVVQNTDIIGGGAGDSQTDRVWHNAETIDGALAGTLLSVTPRLVIGGTGDATVVWQQSPTALLRIIGNRYSSDGGWAGATRIDDSTFTMSPDVAADATGNVIAVWAQLDGIWSSRWYAATGWSTPQRLGAENGGAVSPHVLFDHNGVATAVWQEGDGSHLHLWSCRYSPALGWSAPERIENATDDAQDIQITVGANGDLLAVWIQTTAEGARQVNTNFYRVGMGWGTPIAIESLGRLPAEAHPALDRQGNAMVVWSQWGTSGSEIWMNTYTTGQGWGTANTVETDISDSAFSPQVSFDNADNAMIMWSKRKKITQTGSCAVLASAGGNSSCPSVTVNIFDIWSKRYTANQGWSDPVLVENDDTSDAISPRFVFDGNGNAIAVWKQGSSIRTNRYQIDQNWGTALTIRTANAVNVMSPEIAIDTDGNAMVVWGESDNTGARVWSSRQY